MLMNGRIVDGTIWFLWVCAMYVWTPAGILNHAICVYLTLTDPKEPP